jgi:hypothetical protein
VVAIAILLAVAVVALRRRDTHRLVVAILAGLGRRVRCRRSDTRRACNRCQAGRRAGGAGDRALAGAWALRR